MRLTPAAICGILPSNSDGTQDASELLPVRSNLLILKALVRGAMHGYGIAHHLKECRTRAPGR